MSTDPISTADPDAVQGEAARAAGILYRAGDRILLVKRCADSNHGGTWAFPAGKIEDGETPEQAAARESDEEIGHKPEGELSILHEADGFVLYLCDGDEFAPVLNEESDGYVWAKADELPQPLHPGVQEQVNAAVAAKAQDVVAMDKSARELDINGWPEIKGNPLSRVGVYQYRGDQLPGAPDKTKMYRVYRPAEELASPECIASFRLVPWIDNHVMLGDAEKGLTPAEKKGVQGVIGQEVYFENGTLFGNLKVFSQSLANLIEAGKRELSCGYRCKYEWTSGVFEGQPYDCIQRKMRGNHLALVDAGRMGPDIHVLDGSALDQFTFTIDSKEIDMAEENTEGSSTSMSLEDAVKAVSALMPAIEMITKAAAEKPATTTTPVIDEDKSDDDKEKDKEDKGAAKDSDADKVDKKEDDKAMDAAPAVTLKSLMAQVSRRDALAKSLAPHIGTFDHAEMDEAEVAKYGVKKLGLNVPAGQEAAALAGYLARPASTTTTTTVAQDSSNGDNFVTRHLNKGK